MLPLPSSAGASAVIVVRREQGKMRHMLVLRDSVLERFRSLSSPEELLDQNDDNHDHELSCELSLKFSLSRGMTVP